MAARPTATPCPNPNAQRELIAHACARPASIARDVSYIEAHGTGTELGDPIEIAGLTQAFAQRHAEDQQFCAIGSVKSNIGHLEAAAGIAGLTKIAAADEAWHAGAELHADELNANIDFDATPFRCSARLRRLGAPVIDAGRHARSSRRIAGISSFGAGGANAHVIVEEYRAPAHRAASFGRDSVRSSAIVPLSAATPQQLSERVEQLWETLGSAELAGVDLAGLAYTLQVGREAMRYRLAFMVDSLDDLRAKLRGYLDDGKFVSKGWVGEARLRSDNSSTFTLDDSTREQVEVWIAQHRYDDLLDLWTRGFAFDWNRLYGATKPRKISLPTYPFARERYWLDTNAQPVAVRGSRSIRCCIGTRRAWKGSDSVRSSRGRSFSWPIT